MFHQANAPGPSRRDGEKRILTLMSAVAFLDFVDASIVTWRCHRSGFSVQSLQWVIT